MKHIVRWVLLCLILGACLPAAACKKKETPEPASEGLRYAIIGSACTITGLGNCKDNDIIIPASIDGLPVVAIGGSAFINNRWMTSITLPSSIERIGSYAFNNCPALTRVNLNEGLTDIGDGAFSDCPRISAMTLPNSLRRIGAQAFEGCSSLTSLTLPAGVEEVGEAIFAACSSLESLSVSDDNPCFRCIDNCIIRPADGLLIAGCNTSVIPGDGSVTRIGDGAFEGCSALEELTLPAPVREIGQRAFAACPALRRVTLTVDIRRVGEDAFAECDELAWNVYEGGCYLGTEEAPYLFLIKPVDENIVGMETHEQTVTIADRAMHGCYMLSVFIIGSSMNTIGYQAFFDCINLTNVQFAVDTGWYATDGVDDLPVELGSPRDNADLVKDSLVGYFWYRR